MNSGELWQLVAVLHLIADKLADAADREDAKRTVKLPRKRKASK